MSEHPVGSGRLCSGWSACLAQLIERSTSCLLGAECNVSLRDALSLGCAGRRDADGRGADVRSKAWRGG
jgi:hypothetical protein